MNDRQHVHELIDRLPSAQLHAIENLLKTILEGNDEITEEDRRRIQVGKAWFEQRGGKGIPMEDVLAEFGLKTEDFPIHK